MYNYTLQFNNSKFYIADNTLLSFLKRLNSRDSSVKQTFPIGKLEDKTTCRRLLYFKSILEPITINELLKDFINNYDFLTAQITQAKKVKSLVEKELKEGYSSDEIKDLLWKAFKEKIRVVDYEGIDKNGEMSFTVVPEHEFTLDDANDTMGWLNDTGLFDAWFEADGSIKIKYNEDK